ncbi:protein unc-93 homolog A-like isoform X3 [Argiope bruennichi]|uniref:protein unc-93 homolog A-like isoform X3 n=1 Tax=Argiope bruennichi TaxID=94029 RepID=UPI0024959D89|nr:protein unc-93 homolog A-like isoform X3 [Argiope bruennichi]
MDGTGINVLLADVAEVGLGQNPSINKDEKTDIQQDGVMDSRTLRWRSLRNLFIFNTCYVLTYTGFWALSNLQSTMNAAGGLGDYSQAVIYVFSMISSLFLPKLLIDKFGCKNILVVGTLICCFSIASNMVLRWDVMMTASVAFGLINGPFASAQTFYIDEMATRFQSTITENIEFIMSTFFGLFMFFSESTQIWGNLIAYYALTNKNQIDVNISSPSECGADFFPSNNDSNTNLDPPTEKQRLVLVGAYLAMGLLSVLIMIVFMDPLKNDLKETRGCRAALERFASAFKQLLKPHQYLLVPLSVYIGMEGPFYGNEFTEAYIACSWGVHHVGFVTVCFGVCGALMSLLVGPLVKCISQMAVLILAALANVSICIVLFLWEPTPEFKTMYFVIAGVWGMGDAIWWSQVTALYGLMFPNDREAAFSNLYFWSFLGFFLSYSYANYFTVAVKINILLCFLLAGMLGYMIGQIRLKCSSRKEYVPIPDSGDSS